VLSVTTHDDGFGDLDPTTRQSACEVLRDATNWELSAHRWDQIDEVLDRFEKALLERDVKALRAATMDLELAGPLRVPRVSRPDTTERAAKQIQERVNRMVHVLDTPDRRDRDNDHDTRDDHR
jgi:hypothetical protein